MDRSFLVMYKCINHNGVSSTSSSIIDSFVITQYPTADTLKEWVCGGCGCIVDRDLNAACNIRDFALRDYFAPEDKGLEPESYTLRKEVAQEKECAIRTDALVSKGSRKVTYGDLL